MLDYDPLAGYRDARQYDRDNESYTADVPLTEHLAHTHGSPILDLACGTGTMALRLAAQGYAVTGLDIVPEMIEWAAQKPQAASVDWVVADARTFSLGKQFALIYMLGNSFQHFLTRADHEALFARIREHLRPDGVFLFTTRNPRLKTLIEPRYSSEQTRTLEDGTQLTESEQPEYDTITQIQHWAFYNKWVKPSGEVREVIFRTALRYVFPQEMEALLHYNGFAIQACYGDWDQSPLTADSPSMIYIVKAFS